MTERIYMRHISGYYVWSIYTEGRYRGSITIVWQWDEGWHIKGAMNHGHNVASFTIMVGWNIWYVVGAYVHPKNQPTVHREEQALARCLE